MRNDRENADVPAVPGHVRRREDEHLHTPGACRHVAQECAGRLRSDKPGIAPWVMFVFGSGVAPRPGSHRRFLCPCWPVLARFDPFWPVLTRFDGQDIGSGLGPALQANRQAGRCVMPALGGEGADPLGAFPGWCQTPFFLLELVW